MNENELFDELIEIYNACPRIINDSVRYDSVWGVTQMLNCNNEIAEKMKDWFHRFKKHAEAKR